MSWRDGLRNFVGKKRERSRWEGTIGQPSSANGASSFHLFWDAPSSPFVRVEATLEVLHLPAVDRLHFWALQASFADRRGHGGAGHVGLQWCTNPTGPAVNWGGYDDHGQELAGSASALPSAWHNVNTRDYPWSAGRAYRLGIEWGGLLDDGSGRSRWLGTVDDLANGSRVQIRELFARGERLHTPMVWSEVFAACDDPGSAVRWSHLAVIDNTGRRFTVESATVNYQSRVDGGCVTTDVHADDHGIVQSTGMTRRTPQGTRIRLP